MATGNDLRKGIAIRHNNEVCVVTGSQHRTPGNLRAFVQASLKSIRTGKSYEVRFSATERIEIVPVHSTKMEFSYRDGSDFVFSDPETFEMVTIPADVVGDAQDFLVENGVVTVVFVEGAPVDVELPASVVLEVSEAPEGVKGDSATNVQKTITLQTGITIQAPLFIKPGEKLRIDTRTRKYMERAND